MLNNNLIDKFKKIGLTANEARTYVALIKERPVTGYQLARNCGIVRSVIYGILGKLVEKGGVTVIKSKPDLYAPIPPEEFMSRLEREYEESTQFIKTELNKGFNDNFSDYFFNIQGSANMISKAVEMISESKSEIFLSVGSDGFINEIRSDLVNAEKRGIRIVTFTFNELKNVVGEIYSYALPPESAKELFQTDRVILCVDRQQVLIGQSSANLTDTKTIWSRNELLTSLAIEHIKHDIYLLKLRQMLGNEKFSQILEDDDLELNKKLVQFIRFAV